MPELGMALLTGLLNKHFELPEACKVTKHDEVVILTKAKIDEAYADGRTTLMGDDELHSIVESFSPSFRV